MDGSSPTRASCTPSTLKVAGASSLCATRTMPRTASPTSILLSASFSGDTIHWEASRPGKTQLCSAEEGACAFPTVHLCAPVAKPPWPQVRSVNARLSRCASSPGVSASASKPPAKKAKLALTDCASVASKAPALDEAQSPRHRAAQPGSSKDEVVWTGSLCHKLIRASDNTVLSWRRTNHIVASGQRRTTASRFHQIQKRTRPFDQVSWECAWFAQTLP